MTYIDIDLDINEGQSKYKRVIFPDTQPHIQLLDETVFEGQRYSVKCSITNPTKLFELLLLADAMERKGIIKFELHIPYLMGARYDRLMNDGDSLDLVVIANLINSCGFQKVFLYDVHSDVSVTLIKNSKNISNKALVLQYFEPNSILICPDAGASKKVDFYLKNSLSIKDVVYCNKKRDLTNGRLVINVLEPEKCEGRNCIIIDDLCDGGGTFLGIAEQIKPLHLTLMITHGIFSKGFGELEKHFQKIITTDSYPCQFQSSIVEKFPIETLLS